MNGAIPPHGFMAWTGKPVPLNASHINGQGICQTCCAINMKCKKHTYHTQLTTKQAGGD